MAEESKDLAAEAAALRAERDALKAELDREHRPRWRSILGVVLIVLSVLSLALATPAAWGRRTLFDSDRYVATVGPLAADPAVQQLLAREVTAAVFDALNVEDRIRQLIGDRVPRLAFISGPITEGLQGFVQEKAQAVIASDLFQRYWVEANRFVHEQAIAALEGGSDVLTTEGGTVTLNYLPLVNESMKALGGIVSDIAGRPVTLPEVTAETVPSEAISAIEQATGIDLPETFGTVVLYDSEAFGAVQRGFDLVNKGVILLILVFVATTAAAIALSSRRRRTLLQLMAGFAVVLVVERRFAMAAGSSIVGDAKPENQDAARAVVDTILDSLLRYTGWLLLAAVLTALVAMVTGPYPWAVRARTGVVDLGWALTKTAEAGRGGTTVDWIAAHRDPLMLAGAVLGVLILWLADLSPGGLLLVVVVLGVYELLVWRAGSTRPPTPAEPGG